MYIGNVVLLILNLPLIPYIARVLVLPRQLLVPLILFFSLIGVYLVSFNTFDIYMLSTPFQIPDGAADSRIYPGRDDRGQSAAHDDAL
jgi:hypothetical protein